MFCGNLLSFETCQHDKTLLCIKPLVKTFKFSEKPTSGDKLSFLVAGVKKPVCLSDYLTVGPT